MGYVRKINTICGKLTAGLHQDIESDLHVGLENVEDLPELESRAALLIPLLRNATRMAVTGVCTEEQAMHSTTRVSCILRWAY